MQERGHCIHFFSRGLFCLINFFSLSWNYVIRWIFNWTWISSDVILAHLVKTEISKLWWFSSVSFYKKGKANRSLYYWFLHPQAEIQDFSIFELISQNKNTGGGYKTGNMCGYKTGIMCGYKTNHTKKNSVEWTAIRQITQKFFARKFFTRKFLDLCKSSFLRIWLL